MMADRPKDNQTDKKIADVFQDLEYPNAFIYVITKERIYQFDPSAFKELLTKYCRKSINTDMVGIALVLDGDEPEDDFVRWQNRGLNL